MLYVGYDRLQERTAILVAATWRTRANPPSMRTQAVVEIMRRTSARYTGAAAHSASNECLVGTMPVNGSLNRAARHFPFGMAA